MEGRNKEIEAKGLEIENKNNEIVDKEKYIKEMKAKIYGLDQQIIEKDFGKNQAKLANQASMVKAEKV